MPKVFTQEPNETIWSRRRPAFETRRSNDLVSLIPYVTASWSLGQMTLGQSRVDIGRPKSLSLIQDKKISNVT